MKKFNKVKMIIASSLAVAALLSAGLFVTNKYSSNASTPQVQTGAAKQKKILLNDNYMCVFLEQTEYEYTGKLIMPVPTVIYKGQKLKYNEDFVCDYILDAIKPGVYSLQVRGINNVYGSIFLKYNIVKQGQLKSIPPIAVIDDSIDYAVTSPNNKVNLITDCSVYLEKTEYDYTGNQIKPIPTVMYNGKPLKPYVDYKIKYNFISRKCSNYITVEGMGNCYNSVNLSFKIK